MYYTTRYFTKNAFAGIIGALVYTFNPLVYAHFAAGHYDLLNSYFLPPLFLFCYRYICKPTYTKSFLFLLFFVLNGLTSVLFFIFSSTVLLFFIPLCFLFALITSLEPKKYVSKLIKTLFIGMPLLPLLLYFSLPYLQFSIHEQVVRTLREGLFYASSPLDWLMSTPNNWLYGGLVHLIDPKRIINPASTDFYLYWEHTLFFNITPLILCILGINYFLKKTWKTLQTADIIFFLSFLIIIFVTLALTTSGGFAAAYQIMPMLKGVRVPTRFEYIFYVPFSLFVSYGILQLQKHKRFILIFCCILIAIFVENIQTNDFKQTSSIMSISKARKIVYAKLLNGKTTIHVPVAWNDNWKASVYLNWDTITGETMFNGNSGHFSLDHEELALQIDSNFGKEVLKKIAALKIDYVIIHKNLLDNKLMRAYKKQHSLISIGKVYEDNDVFIIDVKKYAYPIPLCDINKSFTIMPKNNTKDKSSSHQLILKNKDNCYFSSLYMNRYRTVSFYSNNKKNTAAAVFPVLISPFETVTITTNWSD